MRKKNITRRENLFRQIKRERNRLRPHGIAAFHEVNILGRIRRLTNKKLEKSLIKQYVETQDPGFFITPDGFVISWKDTNDKMIRLLIDLYFHYFFWEQS